MRKRKSENADIAIIKNEDEASAIHECLNLINADSLISGQDTVVITPNWVQRKKAQTGIVVGQESLRAIIRFVKGCRAKRVIVATGAGERDTAEIMRYAGYDKVINQEGAEFVDLNRGPFTEIKINHDKPCKINLNKIYQEATCLISFTQLKIHEEATISGAIKNIALGWPPAQEHGFPKKNLGIHEDLHGFITAMAQAVPIDISIVSANPAMVGTGPAKGVPYHTGLVIAGTDAVAVDTIGARLLGFKVRACITFMNLQRNIGI